MESVDRGEEAGLDAEEKQVWEIYLAKRLDLLTLQKKMVLEAEREGGKVGRNARRSLSGRGRQLGFEKCKPINSPSFELGNIH
jgi:hypothetical protein